MAAYTTIDDAGSYFNTVLYVGTGSELAVTGVGFQPDFVWLKDRDDAVEHNLIDAARGATKYIVPNATDAEVTDLQNLNAFGADGFTVGTSNTINTSTENFVSWNWKGGTTAVPSGGTITPTACSFSATAGFGMYAHAGNSTAGATIAHGLGAVPAMMISKRLNHTGSWATYQHKNTAAPATDFLLLNSTQATQDDSSVWNDTLPDATVFTIGNDGTTNGAYNYIKYIWTEIQGFSKFGTYQGNGSVDGQFIYTGFRPAFFMIKASSTAGSWQMFDNKRGSYNVITTWDLIANSIQAESSTTVLDFLSNGIKMRKTGGDNNASGYTYIYMAFAEAPFVNSEGIPVNAR